MLAATAGYAAEFNSVTAPTIVEMLESQGLPVITGHRQPSGDPYVRTRASGIDYLVLFYKCKKARAGRARASTSCTWRATSSNGRFPSA